MRIVQLNFDRALAFIIRSALVDRKSNLRDRIFTNHVLSTDSCSIYHSRSCVILTLFPNFAFGSIFVFLSLLKTLKNSIFEML